MTKFFSDDNDILVKVPIFKTNLQLLFPFSLCLLLLATVFRTTEPKRAKVQYCLQNSADFAGNIESRFGSVERKTVVRSNKHKENGKRSYKSVLNIGNFTRISLPSEKNFVIKI